MKNIVIFAALAFLCYYVYKHYVDVDKPGPVTTYKQFAEYWLRGEKQKALAMTDDERVQLALDNLSCKSLTEGKTAIAEIRTLEFKVDTSRSPEGPDLTTISAEVRVGFNPPGAQGLTKPAWLAVFKHSATIKRQGDKYTVTGFNPSLAEMRDVRYK